MSSSPSLVKAVQAAMQRIAPLRLAEKWDNVSASEPSRSSLTASRSGSCSVRHAFSGRRLLTVRPEAPFEKSRQRHRVMLAIESAAVAVCVLR